MPTKALACAYYVASRNAGADATAPVPIHSAPVPAATPFRISADAASLAGADTAPVVRSDGPVIAPPQPLKAHSSNSVRMCCSSHGVWSCLRMTLTWGHFTWVGMGEGDVQTRTRSG